MTTCGNEACEYDRDCMAKKIEQQRQTLKHRDQQLKGLKGTVRAREQDLDEAYSKVGRQAAQIDLLTEKMVRQKDELTHYKTLIAELRSELEET